ncbi:hypothetical protein EST38_g2884 [Candolleomyces aberdarensis]|uniref:Fungal-type protein kinase domain-containing protein n=1 Tax=Candolleomyces aberdarensis TaxID=2316362 RepID=A0A4Q2DRE8_9AGAR|nr:hypothetical protein EST38_g2884 [Candolleomyces aberdarensis]
MQKLPVYPQKYGGPLLEGGDVEANRFQDLCRVLELDTENPDLNPQDTQHFFPHSHVSDTKAKPDFTAAFEEHWYDARKKKPENRLTTATPAADQPAPTTATTETDSKKHVIWPCIRLAGENASKSDTKPGQVQRATTYLDLLLLSRADFRGAFGLLQTHMSIIVAVGGSQSVLNFSFSWTGAHARRAAHALVYRPTTLAEEAEAGGGTDTGAGADAATRRGMGERTEGKDTSDGRQRDAKQEQQAAGMRVFLSDYFCLYGSCTFGTRTHVFVHHPPESPNQVKIGRRAPRVVKIQLCRDNLRFNEIDILNNIHHDGKIPGVVRLVCHERLPSIVPGREQFRLGLEQRGNPFMSIKTPRQMLMVAYDALEIARILHNERNVIHRDVSKGNILFVPPPGTPDSTPPAETRSDRSDSDECPSSPSTVGTQDDARLVEMNSHTSDRLPARSPVNEYPPPQQALLFGTRLLKRSSVRG